MEESQSHWIQIAGLAVSVAATVATFVRGCLAARRQPPPPNDDLQTRLARAEGRLQMLEDLTLARLVQEGHIPPSQPTALPSPTDLR